MRRQTAIITVLVVLAGCAGLVLSCDAPGAAKEAAQGKAFAARHCQSCHLLPHPSLLDKQHWPVALAKMGPHLGIFEHAGVAYKIYTDIDQSFYPAQPAMGAADWQQILEYYQAEAPSALRNQQRTVPVKVGLPFFSIAYPSPIFTRENNTVSYVRIDTSVMPARLLVNRSASNTLFHFDAQLQLKDSLVTSGPIVDISFGRSRLEATIIGQDLLGNNAATGSLIGINPASLTLNETLFDGLARPVQVTPSDIDGDGNSDYLISAFGNAMGSLSWMKNTGGNAYERHRLRLAPGATRTIIRDDNHDGLPDIWALFAQGEEGVFLYTNKGKGVFEEREVIRFPPTNGSSSFELNDFNGDGSPDVLYTCGDRGDGIDQLKPYHGVYLYINNGQHQFSQAFFFPVNGCIKAMASDFDRDGDLDIAAIGFFTDSRQPDEGFTYLENEGNFHFQPYALPLHTNFTQATTMDVGDIDGDGKTDILIGQGGSGASKPLFMVLKNRF